MDGFARAGWAGAAISAKVAHTTIPNTRLNANPMTIHCLDFSANGDFTVDVAGNAAARLNNSGMSIIGLSAVGNGFGVTPWLAMAGNVGIWNAFFAGVAAGTGGFTGSGVFADSGVGRDRGVMAFNKSADAVPSADLPSA